MNDNHLDETSDTILPIKNALGLPSEFLGEIIREFNRACISKKISNEMLQRFLENRKSSRIRAITIGCVTNVIISNGVDGELQIPQLEQLGPDVVVIEIITLALNEKGTTQTSSRKNKLKRSSTKANGSLRSSHNNEVYQNQYQGRPLPKNNSNTVTLALVGVVIIALALFIFLIISKDSQVGVNQADVVNNKVAAQNKRVITNSSVVTPEKNDIQVKKVVILEPVEPKKVKVKDIKKIKAEGSVVFQKSQPAFIGGTVISYSFSKKKSASPFIISGEIDKYFTLLKFNLDNIPANCEIEKADLKINISVLSKSGDTVNIYCLSSKYDWDPAASNFSFANKNVRWSYEDFLGLRTSAEKGMMTMQQEWVSFNVLNTIKSIVKNRKKNSGFILFTDSEAKLMFLGFEATRLLASPKLEITFKEKEMPKKIEEKNVVTELVTPNAKNEKLKEKDDKNEVMGSKDINDKNVKNIFEEVENENNPEDKKTNTDSVINKVKEKLPKPKNKKTEKKKIVSKVKVNKPEFVNMSRLILDDEGIKINKSKGVGNIRYSLNQKITFANSLVYTDSVKLTKSGLNTLYTAFFQNGTMISEISKSEFYKANKKNEIFIDNNSFSCKKIGDKWEKSKSKKGYMGSNYLMTTKKGNKIRWIPLIKEEGFYDIYTSLPVGNLTRPSECKYTLTSDGPPQEMNKVNQSLLRSQWAYLGKFKLGKGKKGFVELTVDTGSKITIADAMIFVKVKE